MFTWIWIEGEKAFDEYCLKRFGQKARWMETTGTLTKAKARLKYKEIYNEKGEWVKNAEMYLLWMEVPENSQTPNKTYWMSDIETMTYEEIRADKTAILKR